MKSVFENVITSGEGERKKWPNQMHFLCANIALAVGLGNIWRFPYLAQKNGGGTFLIPYIISLILIGLPILALELSIGQRMRQGAIGSYKLFHKRFGGIGVAMLMASTFIAYYYNMIVGWSLYYFANSMQDPLPWDSCPTILRNLTEAEDPFGSFIGRSMPAPIKECQLAGSEKYFWYRETLDIANDYYPVGEGVKYTGVTVPMVLVFLLAWLAVFLLLRNGAEATGGVLYFIAIMPYFVLTVFLIIGLTSPGGKEGIEQLFHADWNQMSNPALWVQAGSQIFFSLSVCFGGVIAFSSYSPVNHNFLRHTLLVGAINSGTSLFATFVIFSLLGARAWKQFSICKQEFTDAALNRYSLPEGKFSNYDELFDTLGSEYPADFEDENIENNFGQKKCDFSTILISESPSGTGLIFIAVAGTVSEMPASYILATIFFFMVIILGVGSMIGAAEGIVTPIHDYCSSNGWKVSKTVIVGVVCLTMFSSGIMLTTPGGNYWLDIVDHSVGGIPILFIGLCQFVVIGWIFGGSKWLDEVEWMLGPPKTLFDRAYRTYLWICWISISPILILGIMVYYIVNVIKSPPSYKRWSTLIGNFMINPDATWVNDQFSFHYDALGTAFTIIIHLAVILPIFVYIFIYTVPQLINKRNNK